MGDDPGVISGPRADSGADADQLCGEYCESVLRNCTGDNRAFDNRDQCLKVCALLPPGKEGDQTNSVACRLPQAKAGVAKATCANASAFGGEICGNRCDTFCDLVSTICIEPLGQSAPFPSKADCVETCQGMTYDSAGVEGPGQPFGGEDTLNCRMFHLLLSVDDPQGHCPHVALKSDTCFDRDAGSGDGG
ncbi:MAG TPA: hypothetical protein VM580_10420 [Labilithrix sp.]|nr:hypothetical protein [Labilithrix sp.]